MQKVSVFLWLILYTLLLLKILFQLYGNLLRYVLCQKHLFQRGIAIRFWTGRFNLSKRGGFYHFVQNLPTLGCTAALVNFVTDAVDQKNCHSIHTLLIDYSKAFDKINHQLLIDKMNHMGIDQKTINITKSFLTDRTASVIVRASNTKSKPKSVDIS